MNILIAEDEPRVAKLLSDYLRLANYTTTILRNGDEILPWVENNTADLILLDLMLPGTVGEKVCLELRARNFTMPVIIITAKVEEKDRILGLELGADDYMCKPLSPREVVARVKAALRRHEMNAREPGVDDVQLDESCLQVALDGKTVMLTSIEFQLMKTLARYPRRIHSRIQLMECLYQDNRIVHDRTVDGHVKKLRAKLKKLFGEREVIQSVYGAGYRFYPIPINNEKVEPRATF